MKKLYMSLILISSILPYRIDAYEGTATTIFKANWTEEIIYEHPLVYPQDIAVDKDGNVIVVSRGTQKILMLADDGNFTTYADISGLSIAAIAFQPGKDRLLITTNGGALYAASDDGELNELKSSGLVSGGSPALVVDSSDDSFYSSSMSQSGSSIVHYDSDGKLLDTVARNVKGCYQLALDEDNRKLYFSETYSGQISEIDLASGDSTVIATNVGIPGSPEPISVSLDGSGNLYYFTIYGLYRWQDSTWTKVMDAAGGAGKIIWSSEYDCFLQGQGAGSNIVKIDVENETYSALSSYVNAISIVEMDDGTVLVSDISYSEIKKVDSSGFEAFASVQGAQFTHIERDTEGTIYAGTQGGSIYTVGADGTANLFASGFSTDVVIGLHHDSKNNALIVLAAELFDASGMTDWNNGNVSIWQVPLDSPSSPSKILSLTGYVVHLAHPAAAVDNDGNIYILNYPESIIYKIADGSSTLEQFRTSVLDSPAINFPSMTFLSRENALLVGTIGNYEIWPMDRSTKAVFAENNGGVDNFGMNETKDGNVVAIHSGYVFRFVYSPGSESTTTVSSTTTTIPSEGTDPVPDIKVNGSDGPVTIESGDRGLFTISFSLDPGDQILEMADWWIYVEAPDETYSLVFPFFIRKGTVRTIKAPLINIPCFPVLAIPSFLLPAGDYTVYFAVDDNADGSKDETWQDSVLVDIE